MIISASSKKLGLLFVGLFVAFAANLLFSEPANAANAVWVNRTTIKYDHGASFGGLQYFVDTDSFDANFKFESTSTGACKDSITFNYTPRSEGSMNNFLFYYDLNRWEADAPSNPTFRFSEPLGGAINSDACSDKVTAQIGIDNPSARRITFVRNDATRKISNVVNGATFDYAGTTPGSWSQNANIPLYVNNADPSVCKGTIVMTEADPYRSGFNEGPFGGARASGSSMLYMGVAEASGEDVGLSRISESFDDTVNFIPGGTTCKINDSQVQGRSAKYPLMPTGVSSVGSGDYVKWLFAGGFNSSGQIQGSGDLEDDAYVVFVGNTTENAIPAGAAGGSTTAPPTGPGSPVEVCQDNVSGMGHILCPLLLGFDSIIQNIYESIIIPFLTVPALTTIVGLQEVWQSVLGIANILFVIIFFIVIFSQATSLGISNYGIKSLLPKLIAVAILANLSFFVCAFLIDFSNVLAAGIASLIVASIQGLPQVSVDFNLTGSASDLFASLGTISLIGMAVAAQGGIIAAIAALAIPIVLATIATILFLIIRLIIVVGFVAISPIIFMGFILPGTSRMAGRLFMGFLNMLWLGPIIMALIALNSVVAYVISLVLS